MYGLVIQKIDKVMGRQKYLIFGVFFFCFFFLVWSFTQLSVVISYQCNQK